MDKNDAATRAAERIFKIAFPYGLSSLAGENAREEIIKQLANIIREEEGRTND
jgi:hypothetical protein